jgi:hypothetical protein
MWKFDIEIKNAFMILPRFVFHAYTLAETLGIKSEVFLWLSVFTTWWYVSVKYLTNFLNITNAQILKIKYIALLNIRL